MNFSRISIPQVKERDRRRPSLLPSLRLNYKGTITHDGAAKAMYGIASLAASARQLGCVHPPQNRVHFSNKQLNGGDFSDDNRYYRIISFDTCST